MSSFPYNTVPIATHNPSVDQPNMLTDTISIANLLAIDHFGFNTLNGGYHKQITFPVVTTQSMQSGTQSVAYTALGLVNNTTPQLLYVNTASTFMLNCIRAFGTFTSNPGTHASIPLLTGFNVVSISSAASGGNTVYTITLASNCTVGNNVLLYTSTTSGSYNNPNITISYNPSGQIVSFFVMQN